MRHFGLTLLTFLLVLVTPVAVLAQDSFTMSEVSSHSSPEDCWMVLDSKIYDVTEYLQSHDEKFLPIEEWCGKDITEDFKDKAGEGRDHTGGYRVIAEYEVGELAAEAAGPTLNLEVALLAIALAVGFGLAAWLVSKKG